MKKFIKTIIYSLVIFLITTTSVLAVEFTEPESNPGSTTGEDPAPTTAPINDYIWVLALVGMGIGASKIKSVSLTNKQS